MNRPTLWRRVIVVAAVLALVGTGISFAQQQTGNLYGVAKDNQGNALPGVSVELTGIGAPKQTFTNAEGQFRFLSLDPGNYALTAKLDGFSTVEYPSVNIRVGRNTSLELALSAAVEETITVTAESPLLDERKVSKGTTISQIELEKIPTARDPWAIVTQTPGVLSDRINVGGNQSGQQAVFTTPGTDADENAFAVDGVNITDMAAVGSSPTYYDFDQFAEMQISTGGSDITKVSAGASLNLVTKRGSNTPRGSARFLLTDSDEQFSIFDQGSVDISGDLLPAQDPATNPGNTINEVVDFGFEAGGPIKKDILWFWGSYGRNDIKNFNNLGQSDNTLLENSAIKFNAQLGSPNSLVASWNRGDKIKDGRQSNSFTTGVASWNQDGPTEVWKVEDTHVFNSNFYLTGSYSYVDGGFQLQSKGGRFGDINAPQPVRDTDGFWKNSFYSGASNRDTDQWGADGNYFFNSGDINHELKFGVNYRRFDSVSQFGWPGQNIATLTCESLNLCGAGFPDGDDLVLAIRSGNAPIQQEYTALFAQDTLSKGNWTLNAGVRYDKQEGTNQVGGADANPAFPGVLPGFSFSGNDGGFDWETVSPRVAFTYALGAERKTLIRASFARFAEQLSSGNISRINPVANASATFSFNDLNGNNQFDAGEPHTLISFSGFDPADPTSVSSPNITDPGLDPSLTDELVASIEHAFLPEFVVTLETTYRKTQDILEARTLITDGVNTRPQERTDFVFDRSETGTIPGLGVPYSADFYSLAPGLSRTGGSFLTNGDSEVQYFGVSVTATKRLSNRWMLRGFVNVGDAEWSIGNESHRFDSPNLAPDGSDTENQLFLVTSAGSGPFSDVLIQSGWSANVNGLYQVAPDKPWGFNVAGNLYAREGYPLPYTFNTRTNPDRVSRTVRVFNDTDKFRVDDIFTADLRIEKDIPFSSNLSGTLSLDAFNVFNDNYVLQRDRSLEAPTANFLTESLAPRIFRLGFRLSFR